MKRKVFRYKFVYFIAIISSLLLLWFTINATLSLYNNLNLIKLIFVPLALVLNLVTFINLIGKYKRSVLFLNISLCLFIFLTGKTIITDILNHGFSLQDHSYKYFLPFLIVLIIVNKYKVIKIKSDNEIESIGRHNN